MGYQAGGRVRVRGVRYQAGGRAVCMGYQAGAERRILYQRGYTFIGTLRMG